MFLAITLPEEVTENFASSVESIEYPPATPPPAQKAYVPFGDNPVYVFVSDASTFSNLFSDIIQLAILAFLVISVAVTPLSSPIICVVGFNPFSSLLSYRKNPRLLNTALAPVRTGLSLASRVPAKIEPSVFILTGF